MSSQFKGTITNQYGETLNIMLNGRIKVHNNNSVNVDMTETNNKIDQVTNIITNNNTKKMNLRDSMILGDKFYSGYPVNYHEFMDTSKKGNFDGEFTFDAANKYTLKNLETGKKSRKLSADKNYTLAKNAIYIVDKPLLITNSNVWLNGSTIHVTNTGAIILKGNVSIFGGKIISEKVCSTANEVKLYITATILITKDVSHQNPTVNISNIHFNWMPKFITPYNNTTIDNIKHIGGILISAMGDIRKLNCNFNIVDINIDESSPDLLGTTEVKINSDKNFDRNLEYITVVDTDRELDAIDQDILTDIDSTVEYATNCQLSVRDNVINGFHRTSNKITYAAGNDKNESYGFYLIHQSNNLIFSNNEVELEGVAVLFDYFAKPYKATHKIENCKFSLSDVISIFRVSPENVFITDTELIVHNTRKATLSNCDLMNSTCPDLIHFGRQIGAHNTTIYHIYDSVFKNLENNNNCLGILFEKHDTSGKKFKLIINDKTILDTSLPSTGPNVLSFAKTEDINNRYVWTRLGIEFNEAFNYNEMEKACSFYEVGSTISTTEISGTSSIPDGGFGIKYESSE